MTVICLWSKFGFCRSGNQCQNTHYSEICEKKGCVGTQCEKRHPIVCFFFNKFGRCKFGVYCAYRHNKTKEQILLEEFEILRNEVNDLKKELKESKQEEKKFSCDSCDKSYTTEKKLRQHKSKKHDVDFDKTLDENEWKETLLKVKQLESKLIEIEERCEASENKIKYTSVELNDISETVDILTSIVKEQDKVIIELEEMNKEESLIMKKCQHCDYETFDFQEFKIHHIKEHTDLAVQSGEAKIDESTGRILAYGPSYVCSDLAWRQLNHVCFIDD